MPIPISPERLAANRRNAQKSTGPKTAEGKAASRKNSFKHGMTGEGIVLKDEDAAAVDERFAAFSADLKPANDVAACVTRRAAMLSVRLERCVREETSRLRLRMQAAPAVEEEARYDERQAHIATMATDSPRSIRHLRRSPEGLDWMIAQWNRLRYILLDQERDTWSVEDSRLLVRLLGHPSTVTPRTPGPEERPSVVRQIEDEIASLRKARAALDLDGIAQVRSEAATRALLDPSREAELARRYEAAAERGFFRALKEVSRLNEIARKAEAEAVCDEVASSDPGPEPEPGEAEPGPVPPRDEPVSVSPGGPDRAQAVDPVGPMPDFPPVRE